MSRARIHIPLAAAALACTAAAIAQMSGLPMNTPTTVNGTELVCTGIGDTAQKDPRWASYPLRIEIVGKGGQWLADADITVAKDKSQLFAVHCGGPWLLAKLPAGAYQISATLAQGGSATTKAYVKTSGQGRAILRFPDAGGALSSQDKPAQ
jgi:hypothetical protein